METMMAEAIYSRYEALPDWQRVRFENDKVIGDGSGRAMWSALFAPPAVGERVKVTINNLGAGEVCGYFVEHGWLGLLVVLDEATRPDWHVKQCGTSPDLSHIFGAECKVEG